LEAPIRGRQGSTSGCRTIEIIITEEEEEVKCNNFITFLVFKNKFGSG
jgi:hypothetical protein